MLDGDVFILEFFRLRFRVNEDLLEFVGEIDLALLDPLAGDRGAFLQFAFEFRDDDVGRPLHLLEKARQQPAFLFAEREQHVFGIDGLMAVPNGEILTLLKGFLTFLGETTEIHGEAPVPIGKRREALCKWYASGWA